MGTKRVRTPHYITGGLGTGNVEEKVTVVQQEDTHDDRYRPSRLRNRNKARDDRMIEYYPGQPWEFQMEQPVSTTEGRHHQQQRAIQPANWEFSALAFLCTVIVLMALFVHLIAESSEKNANFSTRRRGTTKQGNKVRKKKTDEWNDDDGDLLSESIRSHSADVDDSKPPAVYYPYQPRLQQHRHRKTAGVGSTNQATTSGSSSAVAQAVGLAAPTATGPSAPPNNLTHRNYYLNQSGGAVSTGVGYNKSPSSGRGVRTQQQNTSYTPTMNRPVAESSVLPGAYPAQDSPLYTPSLIHPLAEAATSTLPGSYPAPPIEAYQQQRPLLNPQAFSTVSSFGPCTPTASHPNASSPTPSPRRSPSVSLSLPTSDGKSCVLVSPGHGGTPTAGDKRVKLSMTDLDIHTPRAGNTRNHGGKNYTIPENSQGYGAGPNIGIKLDAGCLDRPDFSSGHTTTTTTSSTQTQTQTQVPPGTDIPFMPSLEANALQHPTAPPKPVNVDELHLYQLMETGNISHWEARVAEESLMLQKQAFPKSVTDVIMSTHSPSNESCCDSLASDDPRNSIKHKRTDLTTSTDSASSLQAAIEFSELQLVEVIGGGGFGQVWKAVWRGTPVAVKVLTGSAQSKNVPRAILEEFAAEINLLKGMRHPNICLYMGACLEPPNRAIITELAANGSLWDALRLPLMPPFSPCDGVSRDAWPLSLYQPDTRHGAPPGSTNRLPPSIPSKGTWSWLLVKRVALGAARGMMYLHSGKPAILHRDLKSANILLDESYTAKVCDFGLSRLKAHERSMTGNCGTVQWMAPEVLANQSYNEKADVFSYGVICWELLTRQCPYEEMSAIQCALAVLNRNLRPDIPKWCPPPLHALIRSCMKKNPDERPTFAQIIQALDSMP